MAVHHISVREAARRTHRSTETIRRWIWSGRLPAEKRGNVYYVDVADLERMSVVYELGPETGHHADDLSGWLQGLDDWRATLPAGASATAADLVIEDRRARR